MPQYAVHYIMDTVDTERSVSVSAKSKTEAYNAAVKDAIPAAEGKPPHAAWVAAVTYKSGKTRRFNTCPGRPL